MVDPGASSVPNAEDLVGKYRLPRVRLRSPTDQVARDLLQAAILRRHNGEWIGGVIVETEAYLRQDDPASHSDRGLTKSNASMFSKAGTAYVYPIHARHCFNVVTGRVHHGEAVLIRAIQPVWGIPVMADHRDMKLVGDADSIGCDGQAAGRYSILGVPREITNGPGKLCEALRLDRQFDGRDLLLDPDIAIVRLPRQWFKQDIKIGVSKRIGLSKAIDKPLRFFIDGNRFVGGRASDHSRRRREVLSL